MVISLHVPPLLTLPTEKRQRLSLVSWEPCCQPHISAAEVTHRTQVPGTETTKRMKKSPWGRTPFIYIHTKQGLKQVSIQKLHG